MIWQIIILGALLFCSGFFSGGETALFNLSASQRYQFGRSRNRFKQAAASLIRQPDRLILTLMLGNMTVNVAFFAVSSVAVLHAAEALPGWQATLLGLVPLVAIILFGEVLPKTVALARPGGFSTFVALPLRTISGAAAPGLRTLQKLVINPLLRLFAPAGHGADEPVTEDELKALLRVSAGHGTLDASISSLLSEVVELHSIKVREVMVARVDVVAFDVNLPRRKLIELVRESGQRRIPVYERDLDHIIGVVDAHSVLLEPARPIRSLLQRVVYVPEIVPLDRLLETLRQRARKMAIVVDEYGGTSGLVTVEDVVEELVGELHDADEVPEEPVQQIDPQTFLLAGNLSVREWSETFRAQLPRLRVDTVAGLVTALLRRLPVVGDVVRLRNLTLTVKEMAGRRVTKIELRRQSDPAPDPPDAEDRR